MVKKTLSLLIVGIIVGMLFVSFIPMSVMGMTGSGTAENPYMIYNVTDLQNMNLNLTAYYELANDIDASGYSWTTIGRSGFFTGSLDGKGYKVTNLTINYNGGAPYPRGEAFIFRNAGTIKNITFQSCNINVTYTNNTLDYLACICGDNGGVISNCHVSGSITGAGYWGIASWTWSNAGGICGANYGTIEDCSCSASITMIANGTPTAKHGACAGGLFAYSDYGLITNSFATGNITAVSNVVGICWAGGIAQEIGEDCIVRDCYAKGNITATSLGEAYAGGFVCYTYDGGTIQNSYSTGIPTALNGIGGFCQDNDPLAVITSCFWDTQTSGTLVSDGGTGKNTTEMKTKSTFTNAGWLFSPESETPIWAISEYCNDGYPYICQFCYLEWMCTGGCGPAWDPEGDYDDATPLNGCVVEDNNSTWVITVPYFNYYKEWVDGSIEVWYQPTTMINSPLLDMSGNVKDGVINWGMSIGDIDVGGILPYSAFTPTGTETIPTVIPDAGDIPTDETSGATGEGLPLYYSFKKAADSLGWSLPVTYTLMFIIVAIVVGVAGLVAMGTGWGFSIGFGATMVLFGQVRDGGGIVIVPGFILIFSILVAIFLGYIWRYT